MSVAEQAQRQQGGTVELDEALWARAVQVISDKASRLFQGKGLDARLAGATALAMDRARVVYDEAGAVWKVASSTTPGAWYSVNGICTCDDYARAPEHWCTHRLAAGFTKRARAMRPADLEAAAAATLLDHGSPDQRVVPTLPTQKPQTRPRPPLPRQVGLRTLTEEHKALLKRTMAKECTPDELEVFVMVCERTGLDPFARQIYAIPRGKGDERKLTIQTSIDGYRLIADRTGCYAGNDAPIYDREDGDHPTWARVTVYKLVGGQRCPFTAVARWSEYYPAQATQQFLWNRMGFFFLGKVCEALALRKAFPQELSGLYTHEEMQQADGQAKKDEGEAGGAGEEHDAADLVG
jgi:phage recombination protein Bet